MFRLVTDVLYMEGKHCIDLMTLRFGSDRLRRKVIICGLFAEFRSERFDREIQEYWDEQYYGHVLAYTMNRLHQVIIRQPAS